MQQAVEYFWERGSTVYLATRDASKAFDRYQYPQRSFTVNLAGL